MIWGVGTDIVEIDRIDRVLQKYGDQFIDKVFTAGEKTVCASMARPAVHYAGRWAAKEAFYKALDNRCQAAAQWKSIEVLPDRDTKRPRISVTDAKMKTLLDESGVSSMHVSISHERLYCVGMVLLEKRQLPF